MRGWLILVRWVQTDMGNMGANAVGMEKAPVTLEQSITGMLSKVRVEPFVLVECTNVL